MRLTLGSASFGLAAVVAAAFATGCLGIGDVDRTQPEKVKKEIFFTTGDDGQKIPTQFYFRQTIIDVPATSSVSFIGEQSETERVVFDVQEKFLFAYRAYGHLENDGEAGGVPGNQGDGYVRPGTGPYTGTPIAAFPILSHFDVQRQYNPQTGEQNNVVYEDSSDRPWYDREFIRVDWSNNLITDFKFAGATVTQAPVAYHIPANDPSHASSKDRAVVTPEYIDIVTKISAEPELNEQYSQYFGFPVLECYLGPNVVKDCAGGTLKVRSSFRKVTPSDYIPLEYDDTRFQKFGFFRTERYRYNDEYGVIEPSQVRLANRWNLWTNAASCYDANADLPYSKCQPEQLRSIVYYMNEDFPENLKAMALQNAKAWSDVFRDAVKSSTGFTDEQLDAGFDKARGERRELFVLCPNNPVKKGDPIGCGAEGLNPQIGDLRYSMYYYVPNQQWSSPLGYGPSAADPLTGEIVQGNAFYYGAPAATIAARTRDIVKLQLGLLDDQDLLNGNTASAAAAYVKSQAQTRIDTRALRVSAEKSKALVGKLHLREKADRLAAQIQTGEAMHDSRPGRLAALERSSLDEFMLTDEVREAFGASLTDPSTGTEQLQSFGSAARLDDPRLVDPRLFELESARKNRLLRPGVGGCLLMADDIFDEGLVGLTEKIAREFYDTVDGKAQLKPGVTDETVFQYLLATTMGDTQLHEVGHTMGLRHNFAGSTDALNFGPKYWQLRKDVKLGPAPRPAPAWAVSPAVATKMRIAVENGLRDNQDSSIMDYASTYGTNTELGMYDSAAIKYAYGDVVEVFTSPDLTEEKAKLLKPGELHYTYYPEVISNAADLDTRVASLYQRANVNFRKTSKRSELFDTNLREVPYSFCSDEYLDASATCAVWDAGADNFERTTKAIDDYRSYYLFDAFKRERLTFGVDVFSYLSRIYSRKMSYLLNQYKNWVNDELIIRRDRPCLVVSGGAITQQGQQGRFTEDACGNAGYEATLETLDLIAEIIQAPDVGCYQRLKPGCYDSATANQDALTDGDVTLVSTDPSACDTYVPAQPTGANAPARIALKIESTTPYSHIQNSTSCEGVFTPVVVGGQTLTEEPLNLALGAARPANTTYDRERYGYYFYNKPLVIGSWWDKWMAVKALGDSNTNFIGVDASSDTRSFMISLNTLFGDDINQLVGALVNDETTSYGPRVTADGKGVEFMPFIDRSQDQSFNRATNRRALINPDQQYTLRLLAMFNAAFQGQSIDDVQFSESLRVGSQLNVADIDVPAAVRADPARYAEIVDPVTGLHWFAVNQNRNGDLGGFYSAGYQLIRNMKAKYYVGGVDGPGTELLPAYQGQNNWAPRGDIRILNIMKTTAQTFGGSDVWSGDFNL